jgi:hypothetical protein
MKPGIYNGIPNEEYHRGQDWRDMMNASSLKHLRRSAAHYLAAKENPIDPTPAMILGSLVHCAVLEPERFAAETILQPEKFDRRTKAGKEAAAEFEARAEGKTVLTVDQDAICTGIINSLFSGRHETARKLLEGGKPEVSFAWEDAMTGQMSKCRVDWLRSDNIMVELKSTADASHKAFMRQCANLDYDLSAAWYRGGVKAVTGEKMDYVFIVVETSAPFEIAVYTPDDAFIENGKAKIRQALETYTKAKESGIFAGYADEVTELELPPWAYV